MDLKTIERMMNTILEEEDYYNIFYIIKDNDEKFKKHKNGIFIDLTKLKKDTLDKIILIINFKLSDKKLKLIK